MSRLGIVTTALVVIQLILTVVAQRQWTWRWARAADALAIMPQWKFFALGAPGHAWHIVVRDVFGDGTVGQWVRADYVPVRGTFDAVWNPSKHLRAEFSRHARALGTRAQAGREATPETSHAYAQMLRHSAMRARPATVAQHQFAVVHSIGGSEAQRVFTSRLHSVS